MLRIIKAGSVTESLIRERCHVAELLNELELPELSVAHCRVEPGITTELHSLMDTIEIYVVLQGRGMINDGSETAYEVEPMDTVWIPRNQPQRITNTGKEQLRFLAICHQRFIPARYVALE